MKWHLTNQCNRTLTRRLIDALELMQRSLVIARLFTVLVPLCLAGCYVLLGMAIGQQSTALSGPAVVATLATVTVYVVGLFLLGSGSENGPLAAAARLNLKRTVLWNLYAIPTWFMLVGLIAPLVIVVLTSVSLRAAIREEGARQ